jgi:sugar lactone lactonase YvrE
MILEKKLELVFYSGSTLLESPCWDAKNNVLYCVSIEHNLIYRFNPKTNELRTYKTDGAVSCVAVTSVGMVFEAEKSGVYRLNPDTGEREFVAHCAYGEDFRYNDGKFDPVGRLLIGTKGDSRDYEGEASLYALRNGKLAPIISGATISNGLAWSPDGGTMYYIDTPTGKVGRYKYDLETGDAKFEKYVIEIIGGGLPDGMCERNGCLWIAEWGGGKVCKWDPKTGEKIREIALPVKNVTSCCLGGKDLDWLYITTAKSEKDDVPYAGGLLRINLGGL